MKGLRPLLLQKVETRLPGLRLMRLRLHRHLPEVDSLDAHSHAWGQLLCYLSGTGTRVVRGTEYPVTPGTVAWVPCKHRHGFREARGRRPLCMAIDLHLAPQPRARVAALNHSEIARIQHHLAELNRLKDPSAIECRLSAASLALAILDIQFRALGFLPRHEPPAPAFIAKFRALAAQPAMSRASIAELANRTGYQPDYLNRAFKRATGLTLRQQRDAARLAQAKAALASGLAVGEAAARSGFDDTNYFARWFRRHEGVAPSAFRAKKAAGQHKF